MYLALWGSLSLLTLCFIYGQSMLPGKESGALSGFIATNIKSILDPLDIWEPERFHYLIRKLAHFTEYALLGFFFGRFTGVLGKCNGRRYVSMPLLVVLSVSVSDEFLQSFSARGSSVSDVVIDFSGALTGLLLASLIDYFSLKRSDRNETRL